MNCQSCKEHMAELADGRLDVAATIAARAHLGACADCREEFESLARTQNALDALPASLAPSARLRARMMGDIETEKLTQRDRAEWAASIRKAASESPRRATPWLQALARAAGVCALVAIGFGIGERNANERQMADLRTRLDTMSQLVEQSVLQKRATGDRIETVLTAATEKPSGQVINGLINSMAFDSSVNVRLSALNALYSHADQDFVRAAVVACLPREPNPLVQVSMIDFLVGAKAREASPELRKLVGDSKANADVRESARRAIDLL